MDKFVVDFLRQNTVLREALDGGKDVYATLASALFKEPYEQCMDFTNGVYNPEGAYRRRIAKRAACFFLHDGVIEISK